MLRSIHRAKVRPPFANQIHGIMPETPKTIQPAERSEGIPAQLLQSLFAKMPWGVAVFSAAEERLILANKTVARWFDPETKRIPDKVRLEDIVGPQRHDELRHKIIPHAMVFGSWEGDFSFRDLSGSEFPIFLSITPLQDPGLGQVLVLLACKHKNTANSKEELTASDRDLLKALLDTLPFSVYFKDLYGRFLRVSLHKAVKHGFGMTTALTGMTDFDLYTNEHAQEAYETEQQIIKTGKPIIDHEEKETYEEDLVRWVSSSKFPLKDSEGTIVGTFGISRDITSIKLAEQERREMEHQMHLSQKLESVGRLASGVAHEINTPAQFITDNTHFMKRSIQSLPAVIEAYRKLRDAVAKGEDPKEAMELIANAEKNARLDFLMQEMPVSIDETLEGLTRVSQIIRSLKEFSHPNKATKRKVDLNRCVQTTTVISRHEWKYVAELELDLDPQLPSITGIFDELNQVILNMIVNSSHAIEEAQKQRGSTALGKIKISTKVDGTDVILSIQDNGNGIPESARPHIFDPFFTTKEVGKGTGQGLAISRTIIVKNHGGRIDFETECGAGTTFFIRIPIGIDDPEPE